MTDEQGSPHAPRRRRAVRPAGTVGGDEANLRSSLPLPPPDESAWGRAPGQGQRPEPVRRAPDDEDVGWGARSDDTNDDRLTRDRPPHW